MAWLYVIDINEETHSVTSGRGSRRDALAAALDPVPVATRHLTCGDYALIWVDDDGVEHTVALFEHKRRADMAASIKDGRYVSQAARLEATGVPFIYWMITDGPLFDASDEERVENALAHLSVSYPHTRVIRLTSTGAPFVARLRAFTRYLYDTLYGSGGLSDAPLFTVAQEKGAKIRLDTQPVVWVETLTIPRGMSRTSAKAVAARFPSASALLAEYRGTHAAFKAAEAITSAVSSASASAKGKGKKTAKKRTLDDALDAMLEDVPLPNGKRLGPAASRTIRQTFIAAGDL